MPAVPLLASADPALVEHVRSFARAGAVDVEVVDDLDEARARWAQATTVLVGADLCQALGDLPRRAGVSVLVWSVMGEPGIPAHVWSSALAMGAEHVVALPEGDLWLAEHLAQRLDGPAAQGRVLAVAGACGGAGATTAAVGLALAAQQAGQRVLLVDGDFAGGGIDLVLGAESVPGARWPSLAQTSGRLSATSVLPSLPSAHGITVLAAARTELAMPSTAAWTAVLAFAVETFDVVVVDLARALHADALAWIPAAEGSAVWCITPARIRSIAAAAVLLRHLDDCGLAPEVVVRAGDRGIACGDVQRALGRALRGSLPDDHGVAIAAEQGQRAGGAYAKACRGLVDAWLAQ